MWAWTNHDMGEGEATQAKCKGTVLPMLAPSKNWLWVWILVHLSQVKVVIIDFNHVYISDTIIIVIIAFLLWSKELTFNGLLFKYTC